MSPRSQLPCPKPALRASSFFVGVGAKLDPDDLLRGKQKVASVECVLTSYD